MLAKIYNKLWNNQYSLIDAKVSYSHGLRSVSCLNVLRYKTDAQLRVDRVGFFSTLKHYSYLYIILDDVSISGLI